MPRTTLKQPRPSDTSVAGAASEFSAKAWIDSLLNGRCDRPQQDGLAGLGGLHRGHEGDLVRRAAAGLGALDLTAEVGVVDLDPAGERARLLAQEHHLHQLVLDEPGRGIRDAQVPLELQRRDVVLGLRHQVHRQEPLGQGELARLEDGAAEQAALVAASAALEIHRCCRRNSLCQRRWQRGQMNPSGHRQRRTSASHCCGEP
jgi:hypothetical protein